MAAVENKLPIKYTALIPDQSAFKDVFEVGPLPVDIVLSVTSSGKIPTDVMQKHFGPSADKVIDNYEKTITAELTKLAGKVRAMRGSEDAKKTIADTTMSVNNALASLQGAVNKDIEAQVKKEAQRDANLKEARVATVVRVGKIVISLSVAGAKLAATAGADVTSYISIVKNFKSAYDELRQQLKNGSEVAGDVLKEIAKVRDATNAADKKKHLEAAEEARKRYRNHIIKYLDSMKSIGANADDLTVAMKKAPNLKKGVEIGAKVMNVKGQITKLQKKYVEADTTLDEMAKLIAELGGKIDDRTTLEKLFALDSQTVKEAFSTLKEVGEVSKQVMELVDTVTKLA
jgi:hypothetical protein